MDIPRLLATRQSIVDHGPEHFSMAYWFYKPDQDDHGLALASARVIDMNQCGTTACMAGHAMLVAHDQTIYHENHVARWLGVWPWVFYDNQWPDWAKKRIKAHGEHRAALDLIDALVAFGECPANAYDLPDPAYA